MRVAHVSTFPPLRCGIATFAADLIASLPSADHVKYSLHYGLNEAMDSRGHADVASPEQLARLSRAISASDCDVVCLQHEFGIWGGKEGEHIFSFLRNLSKPTVSVLHTTFAPGVRGAVQRDIIEAVVDASSRVVVLTEAARETLDGLLDRHLKNVSVIPHGVPDLPYVAPTTGWSVEGDATVQPLRLITPGFFREDKGLEAVLLAVWRLRRRGRHVSYVIAGEPQQQFAGQRSYWVEIEKLVEALELRSMTTMDTRYLPVEDQVRSIQTCHAGIFAYQDPCQSSSGTIPLVLSIGRPVICTPFEYARQEWNKGYEVTLTDKFGASAIADSIERFLCGRDRYVALARSAYERSRDWVWPKVGLSFLAEYERALLTRTECAW